MYFIQIYNQYFWIKRMIHVSLWIRIYLLKLNYLIEAWRRRLWDSYSSSVIKYTTFSSGYFHSSLFFFIFNNVAQFNRLNFISSYGRKQPPNNGRRTGGEKWVSSHRWEKATGKDLVIVILYCLLIKYILILVYYLLDHFDWKVLGIH